MKKIYTVLIVLLFLILGLKGVMVVTEQVKHAGKKVNTQQNNPDVLTGKGLNIYYIACYPYAMKNQISNHNGCAFDLLQSILPEANFIEWNDSPKVLLSKVKNDPSAALLTYSSHAELQDMIRTGEDLGTARLGIVAQRKLDWTYTGLSSLEQVKLAYPSSALFLPLIAEYHKKVQKPLLDDYNYLFDLHLLEKEYDCGAFVVDLDHFAWAICETSAALAEYYKPEYEIANPAYNLLFSPAAGEQANKYAAYLDKKLKEAKKDGSYQRIMQYYFGENRPETKKIPVK